MPILPIQSRSSTASPVRKGRAVMRGWSTDSLEAEEAMTTTTSESIRVGVKNTFIDIDVTPDVEEECCWDMRYRGSQTCTARLSGLVEALPDDDDDVDTQEGDASVDYMSSMPVSDGTNAMGEMSTPVCEDLSLPACEEEEVQNIILCERTPFFDDMPRTFMVENYSQRAANRGGVTIQGVPSEDSSDSVGEDGECSWGPLEEDAEDDHDGKLYVDKTPHNDEIAAHSFMAQVAHGVMKPMTRTILLEVPLEISCDHSAFSQEAASNMKLTVLQTSVMQVDGRTAVDVKLALDFAGAGAEVPSAAAASGIPQTAAPTRKAASRRTSAAVARSSGAEAPASPLEPVRKCAMVCCHWKNKGWCRYQEECKFQHPEHKRGAGATKRAVVGPARGRTSGKPAVSQCPPGLQQNPVDNAASPAKVHTAGLPLPPGPVMATGSSCPTFSYSPAVPRTFGGWSL